MSDLPHTYASDINFQETFVNSADTQFLAQKLGRNINYLLDKYPSLASQLSGINPLFFDPFFVAGPYGTGTHLLLTMPYTIYIAIVIFPALNSGTVISNSGGFGGGTRGPALPIVVNQSQSSGARNWIYSGSGGGDVSFDIFNNPTYNQFRLNSNGASVSNIKGWFIHGPP